jgi:hypothetical protein
MNLKCVDRGVTNFEAGFRLLDEQKVQLMLLKLPLGDGSFVRNKFVAIHNIGAQCPAVKRSKLNAKLHDAMKIIGVSENILEVSVPSELSLEVIITRLEKLFVSDKGEVDVAGLRADITKRISQEAPVLQKNATSGSAGATAKRAVDKGLQVDKVLDLVKQGQSEYNWVLFSCPKGIPVLVEGGDDGLFGLTAKLSTDQILFGLVRITVGTGRFKRSKWIFVQWIGDEVGAVARGRAKEQYTVSLARVGPVATELTLVGKEEAQVQPILARLDQLFVSDNIVGAEPIAKLTEENYRQALIAEARENSPPSPPPQEPAAPISVEESLGLLRQERGGLFWVLLDVV